MKGKTQMNMLYYVVSPEQMCFVGEPNRKMRDVQLEPKMSFAAITACEEKPFNFLSTLFGILRFFIEICIGVEKCLYLVTVTLSPEVHLFLL